MADNFIEIEDLQYWWTDKIRKKDDCDWISQVDDAAIRRKKIPNGDDDDDYYN